MRDQRRAPFCWATTAVLRAINERCGHGHVGLDERPLRVAEARSAYLALVQVANDKHRSGGRDGFEASRSEVAGVAGMQARTLDRYAAVFVEMGLLVIERRRAGGANLPNRWVLVEPEEVGRSTHHPLRPAPHDGALSAPPPCALSSTPSEEGSEEGEEPPAPEGRLPWPKRPAGKRARDHAAWRQALRDLIARELPELASHPDVLRAVEQAVDAGAKTTTAIREFLAEWWPQLGIGREAA